VRHASANWWPSYVGLSLALVAMLLILDGLSFGQDDSGTSVSSSGSSSQSSSDENLMPMPNSIDTDLPLRVVSSPLRWGSFSLLSLSAYQGYDTNPRTTQSSGSSEFSALNAFLVYSIRRSLWELDLQYEPSVVFSPGILAKNLTGNAADFQVARRLSATWTLAVGENFRYSPNLQSSIQGNGLALNLGGGISVQIPFLQSNESLLLDTGTVILSDRLSSTSSMTVGVDQSYIRLAPSIGVDKLRQLPVTDAESTNASFGYSRTIGSRDTLNATYDYRAQFASSAIGAAQYHVTTGSWEHILTPGLRLSFSGGPGFFDSGGISNQWRTTLQGSVQLGRSYRNGDVGIAFSRNNSFNGVVSNSFGNHYALNLDHHFTSRVRFFANYSYIQQQVSGGHNLTGTLASAQPSWMVSRNWSVFGEVRYLATHGSDFSIPSDKIYTAGVRWSWVPEKP